MINYEEYKEWFINYTNTFANIDDVSTRFAINLKIKHTFDTVSVMETIIKDMKFNDEDYNLARLIALFHDVGRFNQLKMYGHFIDRKSINHAEESVRVLKEENVLKDLDEETKDIIYTAIGNHNKFAISEDVKDERKLLYSKLVRDADKIDIYRVVANKIRIATDEELKSMYYALEHRFDMTDKIYQKVMNGEMMPSAEIVTIADSIASTMLWCITDIYFKESLKFIYENKLLHEYYNAYKDRYGLEMKDTRLEEVYAYILTKLESMVKE